MVTTACGSSPQDRFYPPIEKAEKPVVTAPVVRKTAPASVVGPSTGEPVPIVLVWEGVAPLHKGFFSEPAFVEQLGRDMSGLIEPPVNVYVSFDSKRHIGRVLVRLLPKT